MTAKTTMLAEVNPDTKVRLLDIKAGHGLKNRLASMGIRLGSELTIIYNHHPGPVMINVKGCKMMLGKGIAEKLAVTVLPKE